MSTKNTKKKLTISTDVYTKERNLIVIHGIKTQENAIAIAQILKEYKDYKIPDVAIVISSENYKIVQIYKNLEEFISGTGPTFEPKQKPEIVLPKEEVKNTPIENSKQELNNKGKTKENNNDLNSKDGNPPTDAEDPKSNIGPPAPGEPKKR